MSDKKVFWLRCEKKEFERRSALTPKMAQKLVAAGFQITVERDEQRIFDDKEFERCDLSRFIKMEVSMSSQHRLHSSAQQFVA